MVYAFYFHIPLWMSFSPMGAQLFQFVPQQPWRGHTLQAYVHPGDGMKPMPGMHWVAAPSYASSKGILCYSAVLQPYGGAYSSGSLAESHPIPLLSLHGREGSSFPGLAPPDDIVTLNQLWIWNLVIMVWWLGITLMSLLIPCQWSILLPNHTHILGS